MVKLLSRKEIKSNNSYNSVCSTSFLLRKEELTIWNNFSKFHSASFSQSYLQTGYESLQLADAEKLAFTNCYPFIYHLEHAKKYYEQANNAPIEIQPMLLFYGMVQLMKACILTTDPHYPENSQVLAHGVTTRKRKKTQYIFLQDEVKLQKNGLLSHFSSQLFHFEHVTGEKYKMNQLLKQLPELHPLFYHVTHKKIAYQVDLSNQYITIPNSLLDDFHLSSSSYIEFLANRGVKLNKSSLQESQDTFTFLLKESISPIYSNPFLYAKDGNLYLPRSREDYIGIPEILCHYLILYNLSMICRYEVEWWSELFRYYPETDFPFIEHFLTITKEKVPFLIQAYLNQKST